jgi:putative CocE/NonD family hydrolase
MTDRKPLRPGWSLALLLALTTGSACAPQHETARRANGLPPFTHEAPSAEQRVVTTRDGVGLATWVMKPAGSGIWPVLLARSPYPEQRDRLALECEIYTRYGYACVYQDARGRGESEGEWLPFENERKDGIDTLRWLVDQPWTDGNVGLIGSGYLGFAQWAVADSLPPDVKTIVPSMFGPDGYTTHYERGMFKAGLAAGWAMRERNLGASLLSSKTFWRTVRHRPPIEADAHFLGGELPLYRTWLTHPEPDAKVWSKGTWSVVRRTPKYTRVPVLLVSGWYDPGLAATFAAYAKLKSRANSLLVVGPWRSDFQSAGDGLPSGLVFAAQLQHRWLEHKLKGEPSGTPVRGVHAFVMGHGFETYPEWPPETETWRWYLAPASNGSCPGGLVRGEPKTRSHIEYLYDPVSPVPTRGGSTLPTSSGRIDQDPPCTRADVLSFLSEPLEAELVVAGSPSVRLEVTSTAMDSAFTAKLIEIDPDGRERNIRDGIHALGWSEAAGPVPYTPGQRVALDLTLSPTAIRLARGTRLRLDVSSSNFPAYHAHSNRAGPWAEQRDTLVATQTLELGRAWLELPVLP